MPYIDLSLEAQTAVLEAIATKLDQGGGPATIEFYTGTKPATRETAVTTQTKLGTVTCATPAASVADGSLTFGAIASDTSADASGTATWARVKNSAGSVVFDASVSNAGGSGVIQLVNAYVSAGGPLVLSSLVLHF